MNWINLNNEKSIEEIKKSSHEKPIIIFKHSTRCSISSAAWNRLQRSWKSNVVKESALYYLDLLSFRNISNLIEETFDVEHQSPQLLLIENGECTYHTSHLSISFDEIQRRIPAN